jgi:hypothetical protein
VVGNGPSMDEARAAGHSVAFYIDRLNDNWETTSPEKRAQ